MYRKINKYLVLFAVMALVCLTASIATAAPVTQSITYQGKLTNAAGNPLTGTYTLTFRLYNVSTGGTALDTIIQDVQANQGLFTTNLSFNPNLFNGQALWLGIKAGADPEMTPRQEIRPVPYALNLAAPSEPISYEYYTGPILTPGVGGSYYLIANLVNTGNTAADACYSLYGGQLFGNSNITLLRYSNCVTLQPNQIRWCNPTTSVTPSGAYVFYYKFTTNSKNIVPHVVFMSDTTPPDIIYQYLPNDFQKVEIYS
jgi:hypothetical protein